MLSRSKVGSLTWELPEKVKPATNTAPVGPTQKAVSCAVMALVHNDVMKYANANLLHMLRSDRCRMSQQNVLGNDTPVAPVSPVEPVAPVAPAMSKMLSAALLWQLCYIAKQICQYKPAADAEK